MTSTEDPIVGEIYALLPECKSMPCYLMPGKPDGYEWKSMTRSAYTLRPGEIVILADMVTMDDSSVWVKLISGTTIGWIARAYFDSFTRLVHA